MYVQVSKQFNARTRRTGAAKMSRSIDAITAASDIQVLFVAAGARQITRQITPEMIVSQRIRVTLLAGLRLARLGVSR